MELYSDTYYIERIQAGDTAVFACLLDRYGRRVHSLIFKMIRNREETEELTQDVFVKAFKHLGSFKGDCSFSTWIYRIAYNAAVSETRKKKREFLAIEESLWEKVAEEDVADALSRNSENEQIERLEAALDRLPPDERGIILLFYMEGKSVEETAAATGLSATNVKTKLHRIRKKLLVILKTMEEKENE
jgi:RNA polymerase sigma-70 factor (ECF subfamily)